MSHGKGTHMAPERALLLAAQGGDEHAFARLVEQHRPGLECFCFLMLGDPDNARDALSETVLTAWQERVLVAPEVTARMWLYRAAIRACAKACPAAAMRLGSNPTASSRAPEQP